MERAILTAMAVVAGRCVATLRARPQKATRVVTRLAQAASMACCVRLDGGLLLPCGHHEKIVNAFLHRGPGAMPRVCARTTRSK